MEADDCQARSVCTSSDSGDGEPAAVRRRLDSGGSYAAVTQPRTGASPPNRTSRAHEATPATLPTEEHNAKGGESLLKATLTSPQECDAGPIGVGTLRDGTCTNVSNDDLVGIGIGQEVEVPFGNISGQEGDELNSSALSNVSEPIDVCGLEEALPSNPPSTSTTDKTTSQSHQQEANTVTRSGDQLKVYSEEGHRKSEDDAKESSETDVSFGNRSSSESSSGFNGDIDEAEYAGSLASSEDLLESYDNAMDAVEKEKLREEDTLDFIGSCVEKVSVKVSHLHEFAAEYLSNYSKADGELGITDILSSTNIGKSSWSSEDNLRGDASGGPSSSCAPDDEMGQSAPIGDTGGAKSDTSSEECGSCEQRFMKVKAYVLLVYSRYGRETGNSDDQRQLLREVATVRDSVTAYNEADRASTEVQYGTSSSRSQADGTRTAGSDSDDYAKRLRNTCKSARASRRTVTRQHGIMSQISAIAEQRMGKINVACLTVLNCVKGTADVVSTALQAKRVARLCLKEATAREDNTVFEVAEAASAASRFTREAVTFLERAVQLHEAATGALRQAKESLDGIQFEEARGRDLSRQVSAYGDQVDKLILQASSISLEELSDKKCIVESSSGTLSFALKEVKQQETTMENLTHRCDRILSDVIQALQRATSSSTKALDAGLKALETFRSNVQK